MLWPKTGGKVDVPGTGDSSPWGLSCSDRGSILKSFLASGGHCGVLLCWIAHLTYCSLAQKLNRSASLWPVPTEVGGGA